MNIIEISVVIPTYNRPLLLVDALDSILNQSKQPNEVIVIDDYRINFEEQKNYFNNHYYDKLNSFSYISNKGKNGVSSARNLGAKIAKGNVLAFLDDDDFWHEDYLHKIEKYLLQGFDIVCSSFIEIKKNVEIFEKIAPTKLKTNDFFFKNPGFRGSNIAIKTKIFEKVGGFDENLKSRNDLDLGIRLSLIEDLKYYGLKERLVYWRNHSGYRLSRKTNNKKESVMMFYNKYKDLMTHEEKEKHKKHVYYLWKIRIAD